jgi:D-3-phosphoglycerate dehydrogenase
VTIKVLVSDHIADEGIACLKKEGYEVTCGWTIPKPDLPKIITDYDVLIVRSATKVRGELLDNAKHLKVIGRAGEGLDNVDFERVKNMGITLVNTPHVSYLSVAELTIGHMIALSRNIVQATVSLREGRWEKEKLMGTELNGKTLGVIGCGYIGKAVERLAMALGMQVLPVEECVVDRFVSLTDMLPKADYITLHVPLTAKTRHLLSAKEFIIHPHITPQPTSLHP